MSVQSLQAAARRVGGWAIVASGAVMVLAVLLGASRAGVSLAYDFRIDLAAASAVVHGQALYVPHGPEGYVYLYPPFYAEILTPFLLLPQAVACWLAALGAVGIVVGGLYALGVRDARVLSVSLVSPPVLYGCQVANASFLIFALVVLTWRGSRGSRGALGVAASIKWIPWALLVWQAAARGLRSAAVSAGLAVGLIAGSWAIVGFDGLRGYPALMHRWGQWAGTTTYALPAAFAGGTVVAGALAVAALWRCVVRTRAGDEVGGLAYGLAAMLVASPILFGFYLSVILIPLALRRPSLSAAWFVPLLLWAGSHHSPPSLTEKCLVWVVAGAMLLWLGEGAPELGKRRVAGAVRAVSAAAFEEA